MIIQSMHNSQAIITFQRKTSLLNFFCIEQCCNRSLCRVQIPRCNRNTIECCLQSSNIGDSTKQTNKESDSHRYAKLLFDFYYCRYFYCHRTRTRTSFGSRTYTATELTLVLVLVLTYITSTCSNTVTYTLVLVLWFSTSVVSIGWHFQFQKYWSVLFSALVLALVLVLTLALLQALALVLALVLVLTQMRDCCLHWLTLSMSQNLSCGWREKKHFYCFILETLQCLGI